MVRVVVRVVVLVVVLLVVPARGNWTLARCGCIVGWYGMVYWYNASTDGVSDGELLPTTYQVWYI